jgi:hypothetical protein
VDNDVENRGLTSRRASIGAGFNKMPVLQANFSPCEIKHLQLGSAAARKLFRYTKKNRTHRVSFHGGTGSARFDKNTAEE